MLSTKGFKRRTQSKNWWIDVILFVGFLLAFFLSFTGITPAPVCVDRMDRREFLKVMGVASCASLLALLNASKSVAAMQSEAITAAIRLERDVPI